MKARFLILTLLTLTFITSCKNGENKENNSASPDVTKAKQCFNVEFNVLVEKADDFTVYFTEDNTNNFIGEKAVWGGVKGGLIEEKITIELPGQIVPTNIRLDFGIKPERKDITVKNIKMDYYGKSFEIKGSNFFNFFTPNPDFAYKIDAANSTVIFIRNPEFKQGTYFYPKQELLDKIKTITK